MCYINSLGIIARRYTSSQANYHSQGCSSCLSARRVTARTCVPRFSPPSCAKRVSVRSAVKIFLRRMLRVYSGGLLANSRDVSPSTPRRKSCFETSRKNTKFSAHLVATVATCYAEPRETSARNFAHRRKLLSFRLCRRSLRAGEMSTYFYRMCSTARRVSRTTLRIDLRNYGDA